MFSYTFILFLLFLSAVIVIPYFFGAPWHPTPKSHIQQALKLCKAKPGEILYDLGCGDGRVLIFGAQKFNLRGVGLEIDPIKVWIAKWKLQRMDLLDSIQIVRKNIHKFDYSQADIIFIYLSHQALDRLQPCLQKQIKPGARIVCYRFCLKGVVPDQASKDGSIFLYHLNKGTKINTFS